MKKFGRRIMAMVLASAMMCTPMTAFAAEGAQTDPEANSGSLEGTGTVEGIAEMKVYSVVLPTTTDNEAFKFVLDPQNLIAETAVDANNDQRTFADGTTGNEGLYFTDTDGKLSTTSDTLVATNKSSYDLDISLKASVTDLTSADDADKAYSISMADSATFDTTNTNLSMYLALQHKVTGDADTTTTPITSSEITIPATVPGDANAYQLQYDSSADTKYSYVLTDAAKEDTYSWNTVEFNLTGACNTNADWTNAVDATPKVEVTWELTEHVDSYLSANTISTSNASVTISAPEDVSISSVVLNKVGSTSGTPLVSGNTYTYSSGTLTIKSTVVSANSGATIDITFSDGTVNTITIQ